VAQPQQARPELWIQTAAAMPMATTL